MPDSSRTTRAVMLAVALMAALSVRLKPDATGIVHAQRGQAPAAAIPVRNERARPAVPEVLVLRNQQLRKGAHEDYYASSREGVWPWYEKIGTRIVGQWVVVSPNGTPLAAESDDAYRLARYASFEHWRATRDMDSPTLGGNGPNREKSQQSGRDRTGVQTGSKGAYFLQGQMAPDVPFHMPAVRESYEPVSGRRPAATDEVIAVRNDVAQSGAEILELRYQRITKGTFDRLLASTRDSIWPWEEKLGARPIGQWKVIHPDAPSRTAENPAYDEVITLTRYASYAHWQAMRPEVAALMGGNGPDHAAWSTAIKAQAALVQQTTVEFMQGHMYHSPPIFMPALPESYRVVR